MNISEKDIERFWSHVDRRGNDECWEWGASSRTPQGYGSFWCDGKTHQAHRISFAIAYGKLDNLACHTCDNPKCVNPNHLFDGTHKENRIDAIGKGRANIELHPENLTHLPKGEAHPSSKLTAEKVIAIREMFNQGWAQRDIANHFGVDQTNVSSIVTRKTWKHV